MGGDGDTGYFGYVVVGAVSGVLADDPAVPLKYKGFHASLLREAADEIAGVTIPVVREVSR